MLESNTSPDYARSLRQFVEFIDTVTQALPVFTEIATLPGGPPRNRIKELRAEGYICLTATGLVIIGRVGHELFRDQIQDWRPYIESLGKLDWSRDAEMWQGNIVRAGKMTTQRAPVRVAAEKVRRAIGLQPNATMDEQLSPDAYSPAVQQIGQAELTPA